MALSKSLRFAVLRRDGFACRYCGARADDGAKLAVDHIIPTAHGGSNDATNLVAACIDCNAGKAAVPAAEVTAAPDEAALDQMRRQLDALQEKNRLARELRNAEIQRAKLWQADIELLNADWKASFWPNEPTDEWWRDALEAIGFDALRRFMNAAHGKLGRNHDAVRYFYGCVRNARQGSRPPWDQPAVPEAQAQEQPPYFGGCKFCGQPSGHLPNCAVA